MKYTVPIVLITVFVLAGCVSVKPMTMPSGQQGYHIECGGTARSWAECYEAATKACSGPYGIVDRVGGSSFTPYGPLVDRELMVECRR
jgi:hypothetical protein